MKQEIIYSKHNSERITTVLDTLLDFHDEFLFATVFKNCEKGYLPNPKDYECDDSLNHKFELTKQQKIKCRITASLWILIPTILLTILAAGCIMRKEPNVLRTLVIFICFFYITL